MKKVIKGILIALSVLMNCFFIFLIYVQYSNSKREKEAEEKRKDELQKEEEHQRELAEYKQKRDSQFIQDCKDGKVSKLFYEGFRDLFNLPTLPEGFVFPEDQTD